MPDPWVFGVGLALLLFAAGIVVHAERKTRMARSLRTAPETITEETVIPQDPDFAIFAESIEEIHQRYEGLAQTDPKLAGLLKYRDALALHGR